MPVSPDLNKKLADLRLPELSLWAPGPHMLTPAVQEVLKSYQATYSHRSSDFKKAYQKAHDLLREVFSIPEGFTPIIFGHTGSYNWEMVAANTPSHYRALGMDIGAFSQKWTQVFGNRDRHIDVMKAPWGEGFDNQTWSDALGEDAYDLAMLIHNETATGVMLPVQAFCDTARKQSPNTLLAIDAVSIAGAVNVPIDQLRPDYYLWSLQKDFSCPTIGSVMIVSDRAIEVAKKTPNRGYVLDLIEWQSKAETYQTPMTVADLTLLCLSARLEEMRTEGDARFTRHKNLIRMHHDWAKKHGLSLIAKPGYESLTVSAIRLPDHINGPNFVSMAKSHLNVQLGPGYGDTKDGAFRIAAMGHTSETDLACILEGLSLILENWEELNT
ncbi:MAG: alanine-glyoxylate transaminase/serine-glyoxylate transaminase/serine-pyruvate transaminase [Candidatus Latescibacterota bacterium]|jgi:alanine-glyoxylate transaminase/serine-glyoxylate transaminase/serine-pyruvate transaminase